MDIYKDNLNKQLENATKTSSNQIALLLYDVKNICTQIIQIYTNGTENNYRLYKQIRNVSLKVRFYDWI